MSDPAPYDVLVVGGGPAGLSAALWLARYRRRVVVVDAGHGRNEAAWAVHGYPGVPDPTPAELRARLAEQALAAGAELRPGRVAVVEGRKDEFRARTEAGEPVAARRVLLAFGLEDELPQLPGVREAYGTSVFHCPDCDGPSMVGAVLGVLGNDHGAAALALYLLTWGSRVLLLTGGASPDYGDAVAQALERNGIEVHRQPLEALEVADSRLTGVRTRDGQVIALEALFFDSGVRPSSDVARRLGCDHDDDGHLEVDHARETSVPGVFAAGDLTGHPYLAVSAAAEGALAALALHRSLIPESRHV